MMKSLRPDPVRKPAGTVRLAATAMIAAAVLAASAGVSIASSGAAHASPAAAATVAQPPWSEVRTGWTLAMYTGGAVGSSATTLYLVSPAGAKYSVHSWPHGTTWQLVAMSPAGTQALFQDTSFTSGKTRAYLLNLESGVTSSFRLPSLSLLIGYGPDGTSVLVGTSARIYRYSLAGRELANLTRSAYGAINYSVVSAAIAWPGTRDTVIADQDGLLIVRPSGALVRYLPVAGTNGACTPVRWKNSRVVLAYCAPARKSSGPQMMAVPAGGQPSWAITKVRDFGGDDYGDTDAWSLGGKTFVQAEAGCGPEFLGLQHKNGTVTPVSMPGEASGSVVDASTGAQLMITRASCEGFNILMRFNPLTGKALMIFNGTHGTGAYQVVADNRNGTQP